MRLKRGGGERNRGERLKKSNSERSEHQLNSNKKIKKNSKSPKFL